MYNMLHCKRRICLIFLEMSAANTKKSVNNKTLDETNNDKHGRLLDRA